MRREKNCLIIESAPPRALSVLLASWSPLQDSLPEMVDSPPEVVEF
jgi:hypothetical protein